MKKCRVCGHELEETLPGVLVCEYCHTSYNLATKTVDTVNTRVSPIDCKHRKHLFICSSRWGGPDGSGRYHVSICADCGQFFVYGDQNGQHYAIKFDLVSDEAVEAAGKYAALVADDDNSSLVDRS